MTQEEKAKAYDEAVRKIMDYREGKTKIYSDVKQTIDYLFPELKESEDEKIRKEIKAFIKSRGSQITQSKTDAWIAWLEKQGEHAKFRDSIQEVDDIVTRNKDGVLVNLSQLRRPAKKLKIEKDKWYVCIKDLDDDYGTRAFHKGDNYHCTKDDTLMPDNSNVPSEIKCCVEDYFRLWTIQDAKGGDVLYCKSDGIEYIVMSKGINKNGNIDSYFRYNSLSGFGVDIPSVLSVRQDDITPANKEQRDILFKKMKEAGYEWDDDKKELKKIIQKPAWSEEDEKMSRIIGNAITVDRASEYLGSKGIQVIDAHVWLGELKDRVQPKQEWNVDDVHIYWLNWAIGGMPDTEIANEAEAALKELLEQLKKLKGARE